jgi:hypothetical protein
VDYIDVPINNVQVTFDGSTNTVNGAAVYVMPFGSHSISTQNLVGNRFFTHFWDHDYDNNCNEAALGYNDTANNPHTFASSFSCNRTITDWYKVLTAFKNSSSTTQPVGTLNFTGSMITGYLLRENTTLSLVDAMPYDAQVEISYNDSAWHSLGFTTALASTGRFSMPWTIPLGTSVTQIRAKFTSPDWVFNDSVGIFNVPEESDPKGNCNDRKDNNLNGLIDNADPTCQKNVMNFTGILNYSGGQPVINSMIKITIRNTTLGYEKATINQTDSLGRFFVILTSLPGFMMDTDFDMNIYVLGDVEAIYDCHYNKATGVCS